MERVGFGQTHGGRVFVDVDDQEREPPEGCERVGNSDGFRIYVGGSEYGSQSAFQFTLEFERQQTREDMTPCAALLANE